MLENHPQGAGHDPLADAADDAARNQDVLHDDEDKTDDIMRVGRRKAGKRLLLSRCFLSYQIHKHAGTKLPGE